jgi:hypothetical protein
MTHENRFNQIITHSLNTSPRARMFHDDYYPKQAYRYSVDSSVSNYASPDGMISPAYLLHNSNPNMMSKLVLNLNANNTQIISGVHHELEHVNQEERAIVKNIKTEPQQLSFRHYLAFKVLTEAQAFTSQIEGPTMALLRDLKNNKIDMIDTYRSIFSFLELVPIYDVSQNLESFFGEKNKFGNSVDYIIYQHHNQCRYMDDMDIKSRQRNTRIKMIKQFLNPKHRSSQNTLDHYILSASDLYCEEVGHALTTISPHQKGLFTAAMVMQDSKSYMLDLCKIMDDKQETYLTPREWHDALDTDTANGVADFVLNNSSQKANPRIQKAQTLFLK